MLVAGGVRKVGRKFRPLLFFFFGWIFFLFSFLLEGREDGPV